MAAVGQPRGSSFEDAKLRPEDVRAAMAKRSGTVVFNSIGGSVAPIAGVCLDAVESFRLPVALNMYLTAVGQQTSAPPHTDKQDVFVLQSQGQKRWRVYAPPAPGNKPGVCPFSRGKDQDILSLDELGPPLIDTVLSPGQMIYMPAGFPHTTDTVVGISTGGGAETSNKDPSVHLTLGIDTHIWGLTHACLRDYVLYRLDPAAARLTPPVSTETDVEKWVVYHGQLPLGARESPAAAAASARWSQMRQIIATEVQTEFLTVMAQVEPESTLWKSREGADGEGRSLVAVDEKVQAVLDEVVARVIDHHRVLTACFRDMYSDVKYGLMDVPRDLSFFRSQPYYQKIESTMQSLVEWAAPPMAGAGAAAAAGIPGAVGTPSAGTAAGAGKGGFGSSSSSSSKGGFGGGGGGGSSGKKASAAKGKGKKK